MSSRGAIAILVGPTASGKTALACALAESLSAEVISADSQQCYRGLDVGTAKPDAAERARAPHHLLDIAWPEEQLDAAEFARRADAAIAEVRSRGKIPLVAGGTGLWIRVLVQGLVEAPGRDDLFRTALRERARLEGVPALHAELQQIDPEAAARILPGDLVRIERALEVHAASGRTISSLQRAHKFAERRYRARVVHLSPPRELLWTRIEARTRRMFALEEDGIVRETQWLRARGKEIPAAEKALGIIGYGETARAIDAGLTSEAIEIASQETMARTRQYAKRQQSWFKKDAPAIDATGAAIDWPPATFSKELNQEQAALEGLSRQLREWYETDQ